MQVPAAMKRNFGLPGSNGKSSILSEQRSDMVSVLLKDVPKDPASGQACGGGG